MSVHGAKYFAKTAADDPADGQGWSRHSKREAVGQRSWGAGEGENVGCAGWLPDIRSQEEVTVLSAQGYRDD